jgi:hypothetical protein
LAEADRFVAEHVRAQLSTEAVDEVAAEALLRQAYAAAAVKGPTHIHWLDGPLALVAILAKESDWLAVADDYRERVSHCAWDDAMLDRDEIGLLRDNAGASVDYRIRDVTRTASRQVDASFGEGAWGGTASAVWRRVDRRLWDPLRTHVADRLWRQAAAAAGWPISSRVRACEWFEADRSLWHGVSAYDTAPWLIVLRYFDTHVTPNRAGALARFNELVAGYWLGSAVALVLRKPRVLSRDERGRLHSSTGPCVEYADGWGFWAWHGVQVPERVLATPAERLTRDDFLGEQNLEVRRVIQERMGERFLWELGARFVDGGPRGVLYEVELPGDPERVARYVEVMDPSTGRVYYLRTPRRVATAAAAVAWSFGLTADEYAPVLET